ncbi:hypothetical protein DPEC_G00134410 [Dallia pectoralis]|uniref:Uncharacterized protein n=1 Tax=Dallia pectoralis TaxID=75939 RepID=A0ACC2GRJ4_DALPE|nr:hypothetical protein DPEC_G00134410 [Dallia pectoralis]
MKCSHDHLGHAELVSSQAFCNLHLFQPVPVHVTNLVHGLIRSLVPPASSAPTRQLRLGLIHFLVYSLVPTVSSPQPVSSALHCVSSPHVSSTLITLCIIGSLKIPRWPCAPHRVYICTLPHSRVLILVPGVITLPRPPVSLHPGVSPCHLPQIPLNRS